MPEYQVAFSEYKILCNKRRKKTKHLRKISPEQILFCKQMMEDSKVVNLSLNQKLKLLNTQFPEKQLSRSSMHTIQKRILGYSYKRVSKYRPHITS